jgi:hypothetical protein
MATRGAKSYHGQYTGEVSTMTKGKKVHMPSGARAQTTAARAAVRAGGWGFVVAAFALAISVSDVAAQEVITVCGASAGYGYYLEPQHAGWQKDGVDNGTLTVLRDTTGNYDVIAKDVRTTFSAQGDGAQVVKVNGSDHLRFTLVVVYPKPVTEIFQFSLDQRGRGTLIWASVKNRVGPIGVTKGTLFTSTCSK